MEYTYVKNIQKYKCVKMTSIVSTFIIFILLKKKNNDLQKLKLTKTFNLF